MLGRIFATLLVCAAGTAAQKLPDAQAVSESLRQSYARVGSLLEAGAAAEALQLAEASRRRAAEAGQPRFELVFLTAIVNAHAAQYNLRSALATAERARELARTLKQPDSEAAACGLLAHIYLQLGQYDAGWSVASAAARLGPQLTPAVHIRLLTVMAILKFKLGDRAAGVELFRSVIAEADRSGDDAATADGWDHLGYRLLEAGDAGAADAALTEGFRLRRMRGDRGLDISLRNLGMLKLTSGDARTAKALLDHAARLVESGRSRVQPWSVYYHRALARRALGDLEGAVADFARTFELARRLRADLVPLDQVQSYTDVRFRRFYGDYVDAGMELHARRPSAGLAAEMLVASEENRASGLRQASGWREALPERYWAVISELRTLRIASIATPAGDISPRIRQLEGELIQMESAAGLSTVQVFDEKKSAHSALAMFRASLRPGEALLAFHLGDRESYVWALTRNGFEVHTASGRGPLAGDVERFRRALLAGGASGEISQRLYRQLFGQLSGSVRRCRDWILVLDDALFQLPFAALSDGHKYLVEQHSVRILPSAFMLGSSGSAEPRQGFVAYGDPLYNRADGRRKNAGAWNSEAEVRTAGFTLELARIPASGTEARECARQWMAGPAVVLTGSEATRARLEEALGRRPAAAHLAVHVVASEDGQRALIALGLDGSGQPDFLDAVEISRKRYGVPMVVLSGCSSGQGRVLPGAGLTGLTRAWLLGGSQAVAASHWPTTDDTGALFTAFYRSVARWRRPLSASLCALALREAQLEMLNSGTWRAEPRYWAAFFVTGKD
jgi:CHAT domain-containing protein/tetratricopeptide (TPR) repeat protein